MNKKLAIILILAAFLVGAIVGGWMTYQRYEKLFWLASVENNAGLVHSDVWWLNKLRTNNAAGVIGNLEFELDLSLIGLNHSMSNCPSSPLDPTILKFIKQAREYREQFPYKSDIPSFDEQVSNVFLRVIVMTNK